MKNLLAYVLLYAQVIPAIFAFSLVWMGLFEPTFVWLQNGYFPERDLKFLLSNSSCEHTDWKAIGFEGMDICRREFIYFTEWVGLNRILNGLAEVNLAILIFLIFPPYAFFVIYFLVKADAREID